MIYILLIVIFVLAQSFVLNHIRLFDVATPFLFVYLVVMFPRNLNHWQRMLMAFLTGLSIDMFCNTPGLSSASITLAAFLQPYILELYLRKEDEANFRPTISSMGFFTYFSYAFLLTFIFCFTFFSLEFFSFTYWLECVICCFSSLALTLFLILIIDSIRK